MARIEASTKVRGKRRMASVDAAKRKVKDDALYLITRHGGWFRPHAQGYTMDVADAGIFPGREARGYLDVEGLSLVPVEDMRHRLELEMRELQRKMNDARAKIALLGAGNEKTPAENHHRA